MCSRSCGSCGCIWAVLQCSLCLSSIDHMQQKVQHCDAIWQTHDSLTIPIVPIQCLKLRLQMGEALICGFLNAGMCTPDRISVSVRSEERSQRMSSLGVQVRERGSRAGTSETCHLCSCTGMYWADLQKYHTMKPTRSAAPCRHIEGRSVCDHMNPLNETLDLVCDRSSGMPHWAGRRNWRLLWSTIFLSVKPQYLDRVLEALKPHVTERHLIVSIAAGVRIASLEANLPERARVVSDLA